MLLHETTIGIYPNGELKDILIVPDGHEFHLFDTNTNVNNSVGEHTTSLGSIVFINNDWVYEGTSLSTESQREIADYIFSYPGESDDYSPLF